MKIFLSLCLCASVAFLSVLPCHAQLGLRDPAYIATSTAASSFPPNGGDLLFWGRVDDLALADDARIATFTDLSGSGNHATQATAATQPTNKTSIINGHAVLRCFGTWMQWPTNMMAGVTNAEILVVCKSLADPSAALRYSIWSFNPWDAVGASAHPFTTVGQVQESFMSSAASPVRLVPTTASNAHIYSLSVQTNKMLQLWNGRMFSGWDKLFVAGTNNPGPRLGINSAANVLWNGDIAEVMVYKRVLSTVDRQAIYDYLAARYGITCESVSTVYTPTSFTLVGSGVKAWWKADSLVLNDGDPVSSWTDSSGNGFTLTAALTARPTFKTALYNGLPAVRFDGVLNALTSTLINFTNFTFCVVAKATADNSCVFGKSDANMQTRVRYAGNNVMQFYPDGTDVNSGAAYQWLKGDLLFYAFKRTNAVMTFTQNGVEQSPVGCGTTTFAFNTLGNTLAAAGIPFGGDICEAITYNYALTSDEMIQLYYGYLRDRWGLP